MNNLPGIFNDVIGPIMRGPSSSHTAASWRVAKLSVQLLNDHLSNALIEFDKDGAWATNYREQGSVMGMNGGLLEIDMLDNEMKRTEAIAKERGVEITYQINSFENNHPNSMQLKLTGTNGDYVEILAASLGGGTFEIQKIDGFNVQMKGDYYEIIIWANENIVQQLQGILPDGTEFLSNGKSDSYLYVVKGSHPFDEKVVKDIASLSEVRKVANIPPIMPVISGNHKKLPFSTIEALITYGKEENMSLGELGLMYEQYRSGLSHEDLLSKMENLIDIIEGSITKGLVGTDYEDRILPQQSNLIAKAEKSQKILKGSIINKIIENVAAIMESKSAMEVIVANPTAGSCGTVGATVEAVASSMGASKADKIMAYYAAGLVGVYFAMGPGFSAEEHACQVECGASSGMAAAGIVELFGGSAEQALGAASMAIQNMIGLVCDPIADRVEAPCLGKNTSAAVNALSSATMASAGFDHLIPLDQVLETVKQVGAQMPACLKCTGQGGLSITPAARKLKEKLAQNRN